MRHLFQKAGMTVMLAIAFISCEKATLPDADGNGNQQENGISISFSIANIEQVAFDDGQPTSRSSKDVRELCSRITYAFFKNNEKIKASSQKFSDEGFGSFTVSLSAGTYQMVVIAHNGNANPTVTSPEEITFGNNGKLADTFYYYGNLDVTESKDISLTLKRAVAMVRFIVTDEVPDGVSKMKFYYIGGSSALNAVTGAGCKNSRQEEVFTVDAAAHTGQSQYEFYTFPDETGSPLRLTVTALTSSDDTYKETILDNVPVERNQITKYTGKFFENTQAPGNMTVSMKADDEWTETEITY